MPNTNSELVKLILDNRHDCVQKYSKDESSKLIREALVEMNGGSTKLNLKSLRSNPEMFAVMEEVINKTSSEGFEASDFFNTLVDEKVLDEMDACQWTVDSDGAFVVSDVSRGNQAVRRQRVAANNTVVLTPKPHIIKIYDELTRVLAGRIDMNKMLDKISAAIANDRYNSVYSILAALSSTDIGSDYIFSGSYNEASVFDVCSHVAAANNGSDVIIYGTAKGLRSIGMANKGEKVYDDIYTNGFVGSWNGIKTICTPQRHTPGTSSFMLDDTILYVLPVGIDKPIKMARGEGYINITDGSNNPSLQPEITYIDQYETGFLLGSKMGKIDLT